MSKALQDLVNRYFAPTSTTVHPAGEVPLRGSEQLAHTVRRARGYLQRVEGSVSGEGGHNSAFKTALVLARGFALPETEAMELLSEWNETCSPPWSEGELVHKLNDAYQSTQQALGHLLHDDPPTGDTGGGELRTGFQYLTVSAQAEHFRDCVYILDLDRAFTPHGVLNQSRFRAMYGGHVFQLDNQSEGKSKVTKSAWEAFTESQGRHMTWAHTSCFRPEEPTGAVLDEGGIKAVNTYIPIETSCVEGDVSRFVGHLARLLPVSGDRDILLAYMASLVQNPGVKFQWTPLIQGIEGNGKSLLIRALQAAVGHRYTHLPNAADLGNAFNGWLDHTLFLGVEEVFTLDRMEVSEPLKRIVTDDRIEIQRKGVDQITGDNRCNCLMCSNHRDAVRKSETDRRFCIMFCAQQRKGDIEAAGMGGAYFPEIYRWLKSGGYANVTWFLRHYAIPPELDPAGACHRAPETSSTAAVIALSAGPVEQEILEAVGEGRPGFRGGFISSMALNVLLKELGRKLSPTKRSEVLETIEYGSACRAAGVVPLDGGRPRIYLKSGHALAGAGPTKITSAYVLAQN